MSCAELAMFSCSSCLKRRSRSLRCVWECVGDYYRVIVFHNWGPGSLFPLFECEILVYFKHKDLFTSATCPSQGMFEVYQRICLNVLPVNLSFLGIFLCAVRFFLRLLPTIPLATYSFLLFTIIYSNHVHHTEHNEDDDSQHNAGTGRQWGLL